ncbi:MAG: hypothetical protein KU38_09365 [Sulfurovum sp. FS08-3]|nr:MAG: hypothetical protein KU38_09365 [Sulfurovum sp. FS08-3]
MNENNKYLIKESIQKDSFSSATHTMDTMAQEIPKEGIREYPIPSRYYKDRVTLLPVNQSKYYLYWEITDETLHKHGIDLNSQQLHFEIYDAKGMVFSLSSSFSVSEYFIKGVFEERIIYAKAGFMEDGIFKELLASQPIHTFTSQINLPADNDEIWMRRGSVWSELVHASTTHLEFSGSSAKYIKELERLRFLTRMAQESFGVGSSAMSPLHKGGNHD